MGLHSTEQEQEQLAEKARQLSLELLAEHNPGLAIPPSYHWAGGVNIWLILPGLWRMGRNHWLTTAGWAQAAADGVGLNVDLRGAKEQPARPHDPLVTGTGPVRVLHCPVEDPSRPEYRLLCQSEQIPYPNGPQYYERLLSWFGPLIAAALQQIASAEKGVVVNCSAGRDRTGLISTLILLLAGASDEQILGLHAASCAGINAWHLVSNRPHPFEYGRTGAEYTQWLNQHLDHLAEVVTRLRAIDLQAQLVGAGLSEEHLKALSSFSAPPY